MLASLQKTKILHQVELDALFGKANKFLSKRSIAEEKDAIILGAKEKYILAGDRYKSLSKDDDFEDIEVYGSEDEFKAKKKEGG